MTPEVLAANPKTVRLTNGRVLQQNFLRKSNLKIIAPPKPIKKLTLEQKFKNLQDEDLDTPKILKQSKFLKNISEK